MEGPHRGCNSRKRVYVGTRAFDWEPVELSCLCTVPSGEPLEPNEPSLTPLTANPPAPPGPLMAPFIGAFQAGKAKPR